MPATFDVRIDWSGNSDFTGTGENVTTRTLARTDLVINYGRDQARSLAPIVPGRAEFELDNTSRDYSVDNLSSPLAGLILPARQVRIQATLGSTYTLFRGHLDDYEVLPDRSSRSVRVSALDMLADFKTDVSVELQDAVTTGEAIGLVLDALGWPEADRDIDVGATTIRWFWVERADGLTELQRIVNSEGPGAFAHVNESGQFVFRDRHHRLTRSASTTSQATFRDTGTEPLFSGPLVYDHGWRDVINSVTISVDERDPTAELEDVWSSDRTYSVADGQTVPIHAEGSDPFYDAVVPVAGTDYTLVSGTVEITMPRTAGQSTTLFVRGVGGPAVILGLKVRAHPVRVVRTIQGQAEDTASIAKYGRRTYSGEAPWAGVEDAQAIADTILAYRAERLPIVNLRVVNGNDTRWTQQLSRDLSDRITIVDAETGLSGDFFIERIEHRISDAGLFHETVFGCEKVPTAGTSLFRFDVAGAGFNDGKFGATGLDNASTMFRFDTASQGFNDGILSS